MAFSFKKRKRPSEKEKFRRKIKDFSHILLKEKKTRRKSQEVFAK